MAATETECFVGFARLCHDGFLQGWHEANGGNLSYRMSQRDVAAFEDECALEGPWTASGVRARGLEDAFLLVTASGAHLRNVALRPRECTGVIQLNGRADAWRAVWGFEGGGRPTSELGAHLACHSVRMAATDGAARVVYHAHCPNVIALSTLIAPDVRAWTRALWRSMTECVMVFPEGVGVVPWTVPGSAEIAQETARLMEEHAAVVWIQHGLVVSGATLDDAFGLAHTVEKATGLYLAARAANGGAEPGFLIADEELRAVCQACGAEPNPAFLDAR